MWSTTNTFYISKAAFIVSSYHSYHYAQACLDPKEKEASMGCRVPEGLQDLLDVKVKVEHVVCLVRYFIYLIYSDIMEIETDSWRGLFSQILNDDTSRAPDRLYLHPPTFL